MRDPIERQDAIDVLWKEREQADALMDEYLKNGYMALRADAKAERNRIEKDIAIIEELPSAQPERCEDCVNFSKTRLLIPQPEKRTEECTETHACDLISRQAALDCVTYDVECTTERIKALQPAQPDNHYVACLLAELFGDTCACNFNDIDEWLPDKCEYLDACPDPGGVTCWEQFLKHREERRNDG